MAIIVNGRAKTVKTGEKAFSVKKRPLKLSTLGSVVL
jgi:hypothetical protein